MNKELKKQIVMWLLENENQWQRVNECTKEFRPYIYDSKGNYLIGGEQVGDFISEVDKVLFGN